MNRMRLEATEAERQELQKRVKSKTASVRDRQRAQIVLSALEGKTQEAIAGEVKVSRVTVSMWCRRFKKEHLDGLADAPGRGRTTWLPESKLKRVLDEVLTPPATLGRWSCRTMGKAVGISKASVQRIWSANDIKPHLTRTFKLSKDKRFDEKFWDVIGLYLSPPEKAIILCCDEKSQCQALERTQPGLPLGVGHIKTRTHDYVCHGTVTLFAALNYLEGKLIASIEKRHRHQEWLRFLKKVNKETPAEVDIHVILDNYATHKHSKVKEWLSKHPRFHMHFTPTSSSWMNMVERFFRDLTDVIREGSFASAKELADSILAYLADHNLSPKRYTWKAKGEDILRKIQAARTALEPQVTNV